MVMASINPKKKQELPTKLNLDLASKFKYELISVWKEQSEKDFVHSNIEHQKFQMDPVKFPVIGVDESKIVLGPVIGSPQVKGLPGVNSNMLDAMNSKNTIVLGQADELYTPVRGSSPESRYFVCGVGEHLRVAARVLGGHPSQHETVQVSVRMEGSAFGNDDFRERIAHAGFSNVSNGYASLHVKAHGMVEVSKIIGASLFVVYDLISSPIPNIDLIASATGV